MLTIDKMMEKQTLDASIVHLMGITSPVNSGAANQYTSILWSTSQVSELIQEGMKRWRHVLRTRIDNTATHRIEGSQDCSKESMAQLPTSLLQP